MVKVKQGKYGKYVEGYIVIKIEGYLTDEDLREEITEEEAISLMEKTKDDLAGSNDGSQEIAFAKIQIS
jgi:hypothetical protein